MEYYIESIASEIVQEKNGMRKKQWLDWEKGKEKK